MSPRSGAADTADVGRTNLILLALGLAGCLALTLMAQHMAKVYHERVVDPVAAEVDKTVGARLSAASTLRVEAADPEHASACLFLQPLVGVNESNLARDAGECAWRRLGRQIRELVVVVDSGVSEPNAYSVPPPWEPLRPIVRVEVPSAPPR